MRQLIKQPNGLYAEFSTIIDGFIYYDATAEQVIEFAAAEAAEAARESCRQAITRADNGTCGQFGLSWSEAVASHNTTHPDSPVKLQP